MLFTICIPTYNRGSVIRNTINSVLNQSFDDFELIIVDDGSKDNTKDLVTEYSDPRIRYFYKENGGKHTALNYGISRAEGELFLVLDSDDTLASNCLERMAEIWNECLPNHDELCGIMGRCSENGKLIGQEFPSSGMQMSYIEFHYGKNGGVYRDCCECICTDVLKHYRWPEDRNTHFVPEAYVLDQIGLNYKLYCVNEIFEYKNYLDDGITRNKFEHKKVNCVGYLYDIISKIETVIPYSHEVTYKYKIVMWWKYWNLVSYDVNHFGPRCKEISLLGSCVRLITPLINKVKRV